MADPLFPFLNSMMGRAFVWGECDCVTMPADWVQCRTGRDPAEGLRLTYGSAAECQRVTGFFTDPVGVIGPRLAGCGLHLTDKPKRGDVGVMALEIGGRPFGAICLDGEVLVALHAFIKKTQKTPADDLSLARKRLKELKS
jgi:hypothetical protein